MSSVILFLVIMVLFGLVGSAYSYTRYGGFGLGTGLALVAIVMVLGWLAGGLRRTSIAASESLLMFSQ